jgi:hypothetical protein
VDDAFDAGHSDAGAAILCGRELGGLAEQRVERRGGDYRLELSRDRLADVAVGAGDGETDLEATLERTDVLEHRTVGRPQTSVSEERAAERIRGGAQTVGLHGMIAPLAGRRRLRNRDAPQHRVVDAEERR